MTTRSDRWTRIGVSTSGGVLHLHVKPPALEPGICPTCRGAGFLVADVPYGHPQFAQLSPCACKQAEQQQRRQASLEQLSNLDDVRDLTFARFNPDVPGVRKAYLRAHAFAQQPAGWLLLFGPCGVGKTHLAAAVANLPTVITSNRAPEHLDPRVVSRMQERACGGELLRISAEDYRRRPSTP